MAAPSLASVLAKGKLWDRLWYLAVEEAYLSQGAVQRLEELGSRSKEDVVEVYFQYHPDLRAWAEAHVQAGTCEIAEAELSVESDRVQKARRKAAPPSHAETTNDGASKPQAKKRGPKGGLTEKAAAAILADLKSGAQTIASLDAAKQDELKVRYGVSSRATVTKALQQAMSQFRAA